MPWMIVSKDNQHCVCKQNSDGSAGKELQCYTDKSKAEDYMKALYSHMHDNRATFQNVRSETIDGIRYVVAPGVAVQEQVLNNYFLPADEIGKFYEAWNGTPITLRHPKQNNGSAGVPKPDAPIIGRFYAASFDGKRLKGEYWLDEQLLQSLSQNTYSKIISGQPVETSTGYWSDEEDVIGQFNNVNYEAIARNIRPNHIAILPEEKGACSIEHGCGVNVNCDTCQIKNKKKGKSAMDIVQLLAKLFPNKKIKVNEANGEQSFEIEDTSQDQPPAQPATPAAPAPLFSEAEIAALKSLAASAPVLQNAAALVANEAKLRKDNLIASIKQNSANVLSDAELEAMPESALMKLNAHFNTNFLAMGGAVRQNEDSLIAIAPDTFAWPKEQGGK